MIHHSKKRFCWYLKIFIIRFRSLICCWTVESCPHIVHICRHLPRNLLWLYLECFRILQVSGLAWFYQFLVFYVAYFFYFFYWQFLAIYLVFLVIDLEFLVFDLGISSLWLRIPCLVSIILVADLESPIFNFSAVVFIGCCRSTRFVDELGWAAIWLYKATGESQYLDKATSFFGEISSSAWAFDWDSKDAGYQVEWEDDVYSSVECWTQTEKKQVRFPSVLCVFWNPYVIF